MDKSAVDENDADQLQARVRFAHELREAAASVTLRGFRKDGAADDKAAGAPGGYDPVTAFDKEAEEVMRARIAAAFPGDAVIGEEHPETKGEGRFGWLLDPIDGTRGYVAGLPLWTTLIAITFDGAPVFGMIDQPWIGETWWGDGKRAFLRDRSGTRLLRTRPCPSLGEAVVSATDPAMFDAAEWGAFRQVSAAARLTRYGGDAYAYALLASGHIDVVAEAGLKPWDLAALIPIIEGAGGLVCDWRGQPRPQQGQVAAFGDPALKDQALVSLKRSAKHAS